MSRGSRHECPSCGRSFARFMRRGPERQCPGCRSLARHRAMILYLERETDLLAGRTNLLHVGPEPSIYSRLRSVPALDYHTGDIRPGPMVGHEFDVQELPFPDDRFDWILCCHVLVHVPDDQLAMREFARVLRPGGVALLQIPVDLNLAATRQDDSAVDPQRREELYGRADFARIYGRDVCERLGVEGLSAERIAYAHALPEEEQERYLLHAESTREGGDIYRFVKQT